MANRTPAYYGLPKTEFEKYYQKRSKAFDDADGKEYLFCVSAWANERWGGWGLEEFPSMEAKVAYSTDLYKIGHLRYIIAWSIMGVLMPGTEFKFEEAPYYRAFWMNFSEPWYALTSDQQDELMMKVDQTHAEFGSKRIILCNSHWATSEWMAWGVEAYPSLEAMVGRAAKLGEMGWIKFTQAMSLPGVKF
jgi:hypothetical protein